METKYLHYTHFQPISMIFQRGSLGKSKVQYFVYPHIDMEIKIYERSPQRRYSDPHQITA